MNVLIVGAGVAGGAGFEAADRMGIVPELLQQGYRAREDLPGYRPREELVAKLVAGKSFNDDAIELPPPPGS